MGGKTFTVDPISKSRLENMGKEEQYYIKEHHESIVSLKYGMRHRRLKKAVTAGVAVGQTIITIYSQMPSHFHYVP